jgi:hypothetical protein
VSEQQRRRTDRHPHPMRSFRPLAFLLLAVALVQAVVYFTELRSW